MDEEALFEALQAGKLKTYVCDFPTSRLKDHPRVIMLPHLGASTAEAEENCAIMVADQVRDYLENGTIHNSVNFPEVTMPRNGGPRLAIVNANVPHMIERISKAISGAGINILDMLNKSRGEIACTLVDTASPVSPEVMAQIADTQGRAGRAGLVEGFGGFRVRGQGFQPVPRTPGFTAPVPGPRYRDTPASNGTVRSCCRSGHQHGEIGLEPFDLGQQGDQFGIAVTDLLAAAGRENGDAGRQQPHPQIQQIAGYVGLVLAMGFAGFRRHVLLAR